MEETEDPYIEHIEEDNEYEYFLSETNQECEVKQEFTEASHDVSVVDVHNEDITNSIHNLNQIVKKEPKKRVRNISKGPHTCEICQKVFMARTEYRVGYTLYN